MFENIMNFFKKLNKKEEKTTGSSKEAAKERLHLVLMQDRANVSADFLELMKQEIIEVIKKYIDVDESAIDVRLTNKATPDGTNGAPALYANIPILNIKNEARKVKAENERQEEKIEEDKKDKQNKKETPKEETSCNQEKEVKENILEAKETEKAEENVNDKEEEKQEEKTKEKIKSEN